MLTFEKKTALITGSSSGIGEALAKALAAKGAGVILVERSGDKLKTLALHGALLQECLPK